jgi:hypothetical protein
LKSCRIMKWVRVFGELLKWTWNSQKEICCNPRWSTFLSWASCEFAGAFFWGLQGKSWPGEKVEFSDGQGGRLQVMNQFCLWGCGGQVGVDGEQKEVKTCSSGLFWRRRLVFEDSCICCGAQGVEVSFKQQLHSWQT